MFEYIYAATAAVILSALFGYIAAEYRWHGALLGILFLVPGYYMIRALAEIFYSTHEDNTMSYLILIICVLVIVCYFVFGSLKKAFKYFKENKGVTKGVLLAIAVIVGIGWVIDSRADAEYLTYTELNLGLDYHPNGLSPQCATDNVNGKIASNINITQNLIRWRNYKKEYYKTLAIGAPRLKLKNTVEFNVFYAHESCAFDKDRNTEDTFGFHVTKRWDWR